MSRRARIILLAGVSALVLAFALAVLLARPTGNSSSGGSPAPATAGSAAGGSSAGPGPASASGFAGAALPGSVGRHDFTLADQAGRSVSLGAYRGQVTILAFPYSTCGPTCILIAQQIRGALDELPQPVPVLFVSADPAADTPARVSRFLAQVSLSGRVRYLTGALGALQPVWRAYGVVPASSGRAAFDRSASVLLLDRSGRERVVFQTEQLTPEGLAHDVGRLLREAP
jgi:protein SCO1/2